MVAKPVSSQVWNPEWPVLKIYDENHLSRIAMPLGGIGTGTVSLGGRGNLRDWELMNRPAKGYTPCSGEKIYTPCFTLYAKAGGNAPVMRLLEGPIAAEELEGGNGCTADAPGMPRFGKATFAVAYPLAQVKLEDRDVPVTARLEAFNPLIPCDEDRSGIPMVAMRYVLKNKTGQTVESSVTASLPNFIGIDGSQTIRDAGSGMEHAVGASKNRNTVKRGKGLHAIVMTSDGVNPHAAAWGTMALACFGAGKTTTRTGWVNKSWGGRLEEFWDDLAANGCVSQPEVTKQTDVPMASLSRKVTLKPREEKAVTFLLTWHFPNRPSWTPVGDAWAAVPEKRDKIGNFYTTQYEDAWSVMTQESKRLASLEKSTVEFVRALVDSDLPGPIKEASLFNLSSLRSQTCFRTPDGKFWGWEGTFDHIGSCHGNCTHVWNYESATAHLFGSLARDMRETEFGHLTKANGCMSFRASLPLGRKARSGAAADGQMGCILKLYREWQLCSDKDLLNRLYPKAKKALSFAWIRGGWDGDRDGVMEGCQHNTLDVEYYGPNPLMQLWYLAALRAAEEMARAMGDEAFVATCQALFKRGSAWTDKYLFNGEYYEHEIRIPDFVAPGLGMLGDVTVSENLRAQLGSACLVDQLVGQSMAALSGLGELLKRPHVKRTLRSILKYNFKTSLRDHFCHTRIYARDDEAALVMASHPRGRHVNPILHYNEVMTGFEHSTAAHLIQEGMDREGLRVIAAIRSRYDGRKRNPFNEAECGHHYVRALASWNAVLAWTGFHYSAVTGTFEVGPRAGTFFFSTGDAWGIYSLCGTQLTVAVRGGRMMVKTLAVTGQGSNSLPRRKVLRGGTELTYRCTLAESKGEEK